MRLTIASLYRSWMDDSLVRFMRENGLEVETFSFFHSPPTGKFSSKAEIDALHARCLMKLPIPFRRFRNSRVICLGGHYAWMVMVKVFAPILPQEFHLYLYNFYLHSLGSNRFVRGTLRGLLNSTKITVIAQSPGDLEYFSDLALNAPVFIPYCEEDYQLPTKFDLVPEGPYLFAGGYSNRDYDVVLNCARIMTDQQFIVAASRLNKEFSDGETPPNVRVYRDLDFERFHGLLEKSTAVIVALKENVGSSGQMVCIAAMRFGKPVIYTDVSAISYYFEGNRSGIPYEIGNARSLAGAIAKLNDLSAEAIAETGANSRQNFLLKYTKDRRNVELLELILGSR
jgi:glycosyltransferase involved in cell wall biosynthesis